MKVKLGPLVVLCVLALSLPALAQGDKLGKVVFPTSCHARV